MTITLLSLRASGPGKPDARVNFRYPSMLVRGPSETGKSYIRDCLWFLLGGEKPAKRLPEAVGYEQLTLALEADGQFFEIRRALAGGAARMAHQLIDDDGDTSWEFLEEEVGDFLVRQAGASGKQLLRSRSQRGLVTAGDLRHWFLLSQPMMISEEATSGPAVNATQRLAALHLFLTGGDDSAIELLKSSKDLERIHGQIMGVEEARRRLLSDIPSELSRDEAASALERVDHALGAMASQYESRATLLREIRVEILNKRAKLQDVETELGHSASMADRFELLDAKYRSDSERLGATWEGMAMFQAMDEVACPLCGTPSEAQLDPRQLRRDVQNTYRGALKAELEKIVVLREGLSQALLRERSRVAKLSSERGQIRAELDDLERIEKRRLAETQHEFTGNPKALALRRSELSEALSKFDERTRLDAELERLNKAKKRKKVPLSRNVGDAALRVGNLARSYLQAWGFNAVQSVSLDAEKGDLVINGRPRLEFGAGTRAIFLTALTVAVMEHAVGNGHPHLGVVVIDSPLKSYADPDNGERPEADAGTVTDRFYAWLSQWNGPGQVVILENQEIRDETRALLEPLEFVGDGDVDGRRGFYPLAAIASQDVPPDQVGPSESSRQRDGDGIEAQSET